MTTRFVRQQALPDFGSEGQSRLAAVSVTIVGIGGIGCPVAQYVAAAGFGTVTLVDSDHVAESNLPRQILFGRGDVGAPKVETAREALLRAGAVGEVVAVRERVSEDNAAAVLAGADIVVDATDNFETRLAIADAALVAGVPVVWGAAEGYDGQVAVFSAGRSLRELVPEVPPLELEVCEGGAILGSVCGVVGSVMATEAIKLAVGLESAAGLAIYEGRMGSWSHVPLGASDG